MNARAAVTLYVPLTGAMRFRLEQTIESLVALLNEIDGDPDLEPEEDDDEDDPTEDDDPREDADSDEDDDPGERDWIVEGEFQD